MKIPKRKLAEWITLLISVIIFSAVIVFLVSDIFYPHSDYLTVTSKPLFSEVQKTNEGFILPLEIRNEGHRTLFKVKIQIEFLSRGKVEKQDIEVQYLARESTQKVYLNFKQDPSTLHLTAKPFYYYFE